MIWKILDIEFTDTFTKRNYRKRMVSKGNKMVELLTSLKLSKNTSFALCHSVLDTESIHIIIDIDSRLRGNDMVQVV